MHFHGLTKNTVRYFVVFWIFRLVVHLLTLSNPIVQICTIDTSNGLKICSFHKPEDMSAVISYYGKVIICEAFEAN